MSFGTMIVAAGTGITVVAIANIHDGRDPFPSLLAGGLFVTALALIREADDGIAVALAGLFLASVLLRKGKPFFDFINALVSPKGQI